MPRMTQTQVAPTRALQLTQQSNRCALCRLPLPEPKAVLDHDHSTGIVRGTLHSGCNSLLGKLENNYKRYGVPNLSAFCNGAAGYLQRHETDQTGLIHYTYRTADEKRVARNTKARKLRAAVKKPKLYSSDELIAMCGGVDGSTL